MAAGGHFGWQKITSDCISRHFRSIRNFYFFGKIFHKTAILDDRKSLSITFLTISDRYVPFLFLIFFFQNGRRQPFWMTKNHFRSHFSSFQINTQFLIFLNFFSKYGRRWPFWKSDFPQKTIGFFPYVLSMAVPKMKLIGEFMTELENPQAFWAFLYKMAAKMACTSIGVRRRRRRRRNFGDITRKSRLPATAKLSPGIGTGWDAD